ncbi:MAG: radical SAM protein [bacterium]
MLKKCELCPHRCGVNRLEERLGRCGVGNGAIVSSAMCHRGEEPPLIKGAGSGTVFLSGCVAKCCFCQNYQISLLRQGEKVSNLQLANIFLYLQELGCSNINWVTPTPHLPFLLEALAIAMDKGLNLPVVYNTNGYMRLDVLTMLDGIIDIYLPDMKYGEEVWALEYSGLPDYPEINVQAVKEMYRQVGVLKFDNNGAALSGLLVRHLVLPENRAGTLKVLDAISQIDPDIHVSVMAQYRPCYRAINHSVLGRPLYFEEFEEAEEIAERCGLTNVFAQSYEQLRRKDGYFPDFSRDSDRIFNQD